MKRIAKKKVQVINISLIYTISFFVLCINTNACLQKTVVNEEIEGTENPGISNLKVNDLLVVDSTTLLVLLKNEPTLLVVKFSEGQVYNADTISLVVSERLLYNSLSYDGEWVYINKHTSSGINVLRMGLNDYEVRDLGVVDVDENIIRIIESKNGPLCFNENGILYKINYDSMFFDNWLDVGFEIIDLFQTGPSDFLLLVNEYDSALANGLDSDHTNEEYGVVYQYNLETGISKKIDINEHVESLIAYDTSASILVVRQFKYLHAAWFNYYELDGSIVSYSHSWNKVDSRNPFGIGVDYLDGALFYAFFQDDKLIVDIEELD